MKTHELKATPDYFDRLADGSKTFDVRRDDRGFQAGDLLIIRPFDPKQHDCPDLNCSQNWRRRDAPALRYRIGFVAKGFFFGLDLGEHAILSLLPADPVDDVAPLLATPMAPTRAGAAA